MNYHQYSIDVILNNQHSSGAFIASPNFPTYAYSWIRDGSYIAYALDRVNQQHNSRKFHIWCAQVVKRQQEVILSLIDKDSKGLNISPDEFLPARYTLDGFRTGDDWTDFQLDGYGTWLWSLSDHIHKTGDESLLIGVVPAVNLIVSYLSTFWNYPCYDCWEENLEAVHLYTLISIHGGLKSTLALNSIASKKMIRETIRKIENFIISKGVDKEGFVKKLIYPDGKYLKSKLSHQVDASLMGLVVPLQMDFLDEKIINKTLEKVENDLYYPGGLVYRYLDDTYYGGGQWILLGAWLAWYWCRSGQHDKAIKMKNTIEAKADPTGNFPEQVPDNLLAPAYYQKWVSRWGEIANPLLWSHAMYLILCDELGSTDNAS